MEKPFIEKEKKQIIFLIDLLDKLKDHTEKLEFVIKIQDNHIELLHEEIELDSKNKIRKGIFIGVAICVILNLIVNLLIL